MSNIPSLEQIKAMLQSTASTTLKNAPVQSVNGQKGDVKVPTEGEVLALINQQLGVIENGTY